MEKTQVEEEDTINMDEEGHMVVVKVRFGSIFILVVLNNFSFFHEGRDSSHPAGGPPSESTGAFY